MSPASWDQGWECGGRRGQGTDPEGAASLFVWATWAFTFIALMTLIGRFSNKHPHYDDWDLIPAVSGDQPLTLSWLLSQHNEHRMPLAKLIFVALHGPAGCDMRRGCSSAHSAWAGSHSR